MSILKTEPADYAFPKWGKNTITECGLSKREYFAAMALQGIIANMADKIDGKTAMLAAKASVDYADALIIALNENN